MNRTQLALLTDCAIPVQFKKGQVILREGRNREVRRLFEAFQLQVSRLMRVRFGPVNLPPRVKRGQMLKLEQKEVVGLLEWAELAVPNAPLKQLSQREKDKSTTVFTPKVRKQRVSALDRPSRDAATEGEARPYRGKTDAARNSLAKKPAPRKPANRRVRQTSDLSAPQMQKKSDRNRGRG